MTVLTEARRTGEFIHSEANGTISREEVTIAAAAPALKAGAVLGIIAASGKYTVYDNTASDGTQVAAAVLYSAVADSASDQKAVVIRRHAEVNGNLIDWGSNDSTGITAGTADLAALSILVR